MSTVIDVKHLTKQFDSFTAVDDLSFTVQDRDVYGFLGQNGAGKSTTLRMLLTLIQPTAGDIHVFGYSIHTHKKDILRQIGAVIEKPDVYKYLSAYDNLQLFAKLCGMNPSHQQLMDQLELVGLAERAKDIVKTYSQGMKQRLGIAIALIHQPQLVILDEPTNGLDPQGIADIRNLILRLSREMGKTVVVSSHLLSEIEQMATQVLIIDRGKKKVEGKSVDLFDPAQTIVKVDVADFDNAIEKMKTSIWNTHLSADGGQSLLFSLHRDQLPQLYKDLAALDISVISFQPRHSLEDYFLKITSGKPHVQAYTN